MTQGQKGDRTLQAPPQHLDREAGQHHNTARPGRRAVLPITGPWSITAKIPGVADANGTPRGVL